MPQPDLVGLERALLAAGVAPRFARRTVEELGDHCADAEADAIAAGYAPAEAARIVRATIGRDADIVAAVSAQAALLQWSRRWPRSARCLTTVSALPVAPIVYCAEHGPAIARWSVSASLATLVTAMLLFSLQWAVTNGALPL